MTAYATQADFEAFVEGWTTTNPAALGRLLDRASREVDYLMGPRPVDPATGLKLVPSSLTTWERAALSRATCAQAEYLNSLDPAQALSGRAPESIKGPDFEVKYASSSSGAAGGGLSRFAPRVLVELSTISHLRATRARVTPGR